MLEAVAPHRLAGQSHKHGCEVTLLSPQSRPTTDNALDLPCAKSGLCGRTICDRHPTDNKQEHGQSQCLFHKYFACLGGKTRRGRNDKQSPCIKHAALHSSRFAQATHALKSLYAQNTSPVSVLYVTGLRAVTFPQDCHRPAVFSAVVDQAPLRRDCPCTGPNSLSSVI